VFIDIRLGADVTYEAFAAALDRLVRRLKREAGVAQSLTRLAMREPPAS
jgi:hypothetical protein